MFQLVTFIILLNEIFLYSSAPLTSMAAPQPLAGGKDEMNSSLIRNNNNKNTHKAPSAFYFSFPFRGGGDALGVPSPCPLLCSLGVPLAELEVGRGWWSPSPGHLTGDGGCSLLWSLCPPPPPLLLCSADSLEAGCAAGVSRRPSQSCPQEGKVRQLFCLFFRNSVCGLIEMLHRAAALEQVLLVSVSWARLALCFLLTSAGLEVPKSQLFVLLSSLRCI